MYLGKYLLENNILKEEEIIDAILSQLESSPLLIRILLDLNLISRPVLINAIDKSIKSKTSVTQYLLDSKIVSREDIDKALAEQSKQTKSLAQIIVERDLISIEDCKKAIENADISKDKEKQDLTSSSNINSQMENDQTTEDDGDEISWAALETLKETGAVSEEEIKKLEEKLKKKSEVNVPAQSNQIIDAQLLPFFSFLDESKIKYLHSLIEKADLANLNLEIKSLLGAVKLSNLKVIEKLVSSWLKAIEKDGSSFLKSIKSDVTDFIFLLEEIVNDLRGHSKEAVTFNSVEIKSKYMSSLKKALDLVKKVG